MAPRLIGETLIDQYRVDEFIAAGGMGAVYRVWDLKRNVPLAMKVLHADLSEDPTAAKRFQREAGALKDLAHPNIVPFYGLFQTPDFSFLLTAFVDGPTLKDLLAHRRGASFSPTEALTFLKALSAALGYAHVNGFVHCDVKPGNVMLDQAGNIFLADFGIARTTTGATTTTLGTAGTPAYMAPEQIRGETLTPAADIYALGVLLFELLTGQRPFRGDEAETQSAGRSTGERIIYAHLNLPAPDPRQLNPDIPPLLAQAILQALQKDPASRFANVRAFYAACTGALGVSSSSVPDRFAMGVAIEIAGEQTLAATPPPPPTDYKSPPLAPGTGSSPPPQKPAWRAIAIIAGGGILLLLLVAGLVYARTRRDNSKQVAQVTSTLTATLPSVIEPTRQPTSIPTNTPETIASPSPSPTNAPDWRQGKLVFPRDTNNSRALFVLDLSSNAEPELVAAPPTGQRFMGPVWSPAGDRIAFYNQTTKEVLLMVADPGIQPITLAQGTQPTWSPDGRQILYRAGDGTFVVRDATSLATVNQMAVDPSANLPDWSPLDEMIAYAINASDGATSLWQQPLVGGNPILLTNRSFQNYAPAFSHDGQFIAYQSDEESGKSEIWVMDRNGSNPRRLTETFGDAWSRAPTWSPDDQWIAFVSSQSGSIGSDYGEVFIIPAAGGDPIQVTFTGGAVYDWRVHWGR